MWLELIEGYTRVGITSSVCSLLWRVALSSSSIGTSREGWSNLSPPQIWSNLWRPQIWSNLPPHQILISARPAWSVVFDLHRFLDLALHIFFFWQFPWRVCFHQCWKTTYLNSITRLTTLLPLCRTVRDTLAIRGLPMRASFLAAGISHNKHLKGIIHLKVLYYLNWI